MNFLKATVEMLELRGEFFIAVRTSRLAQNVRLGDWPVGMNAEPLFTTGIPCQFCSMFVASGGHGPNRTTLLFGLANSLNSSNAHKS